MYVINSYPLRHSRIGSSAFGYADDSTVVHTKLCLYCYQQADKRNGLLQSMKDLNNSALQTKDVETDNTLLHSSF